MKKLIYIALLSLFSLWYQAQTPGFKIKFEKYDDFAKHVHAGMIINTGVGAIVYYKTKNTLKACFLGWSAGVLAGGIKEGIYDHLMHRGVASWEDFFATAWGATVSFPIVRVGIDVHERKVYEREFWEHYGDSLRNIHQYDSLPIPIKLD